MLSSGRPVSVRTLLQALWDDQPPQRARKDLQIYVSRLRGYLREAGASAQIITHYGGYIFQPRHDVVDFVRYKTLLTSGRAAHRDNRLDLAAEQLYEAVSLWRGPPVAELDTRWMEQRRDDLENYDRVTGYQALFDVELERGNHREVLQLLDEVVEGHELDSKYIAQRLAALDGCGLYADFDAYWRHVYRRTVESFGTGPARELQDLHSRLLHERDNLIRGRASPPRPRPPAQLPPTTSEFVGRREELTRLESLLARSRMASPTAMMIVALTGPAGVGKTELAVRWAHLVRKQFHHGQLFADLAGYAPGEPIHPSAILADFLDALGMPAAHIPATLAGRSALLRTMLDERHVLVVLDNARDSDQVRPLLPGSLNCVVVVTSRHRLTDLVTRHGAYRLAVPPLGPAESSELLRRLLDGPASRLDAARIDALAALPAGLPRAIRITAELDTTDPPGPVDLLQAGESVSQTLHASLSWSYSALPGDTARLFRLLSLHPGPDFTHGVAAALGELSGEQARQCLTILASLHLIEARDDRFSFPTLVRAFAAQCLSAAGPPSQYAAARRRMLGWYLRGLWNAEQAISPFRTATPAIDGANDHGDPTFDQRGNAVEWLRAESANIAAAVRLAAQHELGQATGMLRVLRPHIMREDPPGDWVEIHNAVLVAVRTAGDLSGEVDVLNSLAVAHARTGAVDKKLECLQLAVTLARVAGNRTGEAESLHLLADHCHRNGRAGTAVEYLHQALAIHDDLNEPSLRAAIHVTLGLAHARLNQFDQALESLAQSLAIYDNLGNRMSQVKTLTQLGLVARQAGRNDEAIRLLERAIAADGYLLADREDLLIARLTLSELCCADRPTLVLTHAREAIGRCRPGQDYHYMVRAQIALVRALHAIGQSDEARREAHKTIALISEFDDPRNNDLRRQLELFNTGPKPS